MTTNATTPAAQLVVSSRTDAEWLTVTEAAEVRGCDPADALALLESWCSDGTELPCRPVDASRATTISTDDGTWEDSVEFETRTWDFILFEVQDA